VHGHLLDKGMYGRKVKKRIKHPREDLLRWKSVIVPYENYNYMYGKLYRVAKFLVRFVGGGCNYLGIRWITHSFLDVRTLHMISCDCSILYDFTI